MTSLYLSWHDPADPDFREPLGALPAGSALRLRLNSTAQNAFLCLNGTDWQREYPMLPQNGGFSLTLTLPSRPEALFYSFRLEGVLGEELYAPAEGFRLTVYAADFTTPAWLRQGVMYQIFPDRFAKSGDSHADGKLSAALSYHQSRGRTFRLHESWQEAPDWQGEDYQPLDIFGGSLDGIREHLDYLAALGVTVIYLNPVFEAASNHRYNTADYEQVDPLLGGNEALRRLLEAARARGMRVILDGVFSHTGADSRYFDAAGTYGGGACSGSASPFRSWYDFDPRYRHGYRCWWDFPSLPEVREEDPSWQDYILCGEEAIVKRWLRQGVSGWRMDVADELPDTVLELLRREVKSEDPEAGIIGEVWEDPVIKKSYGCHRRYALGGALDSVMNYPLRGALLRFSWGEMSAADTADFLLSQRLNYPPPLYQCLMNLLSSHDVARVRTALAVGHEGREWSREEQWAAQNRLSMADLARASRLQALLALIVWSLPGLPAIYYGDEQGMNGLCDPFDRATFREEVFPLVDWYAQLGRLRRELTVLTTGAVCCWSPVADVLAVLRWDGERCLLAVVNRSGEERTAELKIAPPARGLTRDEAASLAAADFKQAVSLLDASEPLSMQNHFLTVRLAPLSGLLLELL